ncbi:esterase/lipase family protein [Paucibacter sp. DJ2R-2]|uniref:esterase/lipase family protein n=1 Tax=Paucibacter sp. DJ2R-2 TaxID=2893558 RepID=UPI0021E39DA8|nr:alpha/beta fold hydrolase [Paucibacter sp. DJ2R-2]MCV2423621.1 alpha/beta fold hydrolase [Paucibacter sp. DJ4R-1]MCV2441456.1 alpha/beta fold hydrolase [Paucibacter sp. DJ2R-2]
MNAKLQRWQLFLRLVMTLGLMAVVWRAYGWGPVFGLSVLVFWAHAPFMLLTFAALRWVNRQESPSWLALLRAWWHELASLDLVFAWQQPFACERWPDASPPTAGRFRPVVFLHGYTCNRGLWNPWLRGLSEQGVPVRALTLEPAFGSIDAYAESIETAIRDLEQRYPGNPPVVVAHSMGGLALRAWYRKHGRAGRLARILTLGTPHAGTLLARFGRGRNGQEMRRGSLWLDDLAAQDSPSLAAELDCYYSRCDQIVCPVETARLPGARAIEIESTGHLGLVFHPRIQEDVWQLLQLSPEGAAAPVG